MHRMLVAVLFVPLLLLPLLALAQGAKLVDRIVAVVNKEVITLTELDERVGRAERELARRKNFANQVRGYAASALRDELELVLAGPDSVGSEALDGLLRELGLELPDLG